MSMLSPDAPNLRRVSVECGYFPIPFRPGPSSGKPAAPTLMRESAAASRTASYLAASRSSEIYSPAEQHQAKYKKGNKKQVYISTRVRSHPKNEYLVLYYLRGAIVNITKYCQ